MPDALTCFIVPEHFEATGLEFQERGHSLNPVCVTVKTTILTFTIHHSLIRGFIPKHTKRRWSPRISTWRSEQGPSEQGQANRIVWPGVPTCLESAIASWVRFVLGASPPVPGIPPQVLHTALWCLRSPHGCARTGSSHPPEMLHARKWCSCYVLNHRNKGAVGKDQGLARRSSG